MTLIWLMDHMSKCEVELMVFKEMAPSKTTLYTLFLSSKSENLLEKITRFKITENNY